MWGAVGYGLLYNSPFSWRVSRDARVPHRIVVAVTAAVAAVVVAAVAAAVVAEVGQRARLQLDPTVWLEERAQIAKRGVDDQQHDDVAVFAFRSGVLWWRAGEDVADGHRGATYSSSGELAVPICTSRYGDGAFPRYTCAIASRQSPLKQLRNTTDSLTKSSSKALSLQPSPATQQ